MNTRLTTTDPQRQFILDNTHHLAAFAWEGFQTFGRGAVAVEVDQLQEDVAHGTRLPPFLAYATAGFPSPDAQRMVDDYDPQRQIVALFFWTDGGQQRHAAYRVATDPPPCDTVYLGDVGQVKIRI